MQGILLMLYILLYLHAMSMLSGSLVTTAWRILRFRWRRRPPDMEDSCEYILLTVTGIQQGLALQLGGWMGVTTPTNPVKNLASYEICNRASDPDRLFGTT
jgi:hypothetical protein